MNLKAFVMGVVANQDTAVTSVCETVYENTKTAAARVAFICDNGTSVFYMDYVFKVLSKRTMYVQ